MKRTILLMTPLVNETSHEYIDRILLKANEHNIPVNLIINIAKGFHASLKTIIIHKDTKSVDEHAAVIADKCLETKFTISPQVNSIIFH